ncbi:Ig-like domain-containing protein, partial [Lyngbya sp. CCY1209]|uniref:Ig-like domain-containing protein n=1 Tax=Lyngbya sp. CCY1209 TaxID=2886103 RepID=UPI002D2056C9
ANITVTVENTAPTATNDTAATAPGTPVTFNITDNDSDSENNLDPSTVDLDPDTPGQQTSFAVEGEGTYSVDTEGNVTFTPEEGFIGEATP